MWAEDGQPLRFYTYSGIAIGWLERGHPYPVGATPTHVVTRVAEMLQDLVWGPSQMGHHHCNLGFCGVRLRARTFLERIPIPHSFGYLREGIEHHVASQAEREALIRRTIGRHHRRHHVPNLLSEVHVPQGGGSLRLKLKLWCVQVVDTLAIAARRGIGAATNALDPHPYEQYWDSTPIDVGAANLLIPGISQVYITPSMVLHYIFQHHYRAPDAFCDAVSRCPTIGTRAYFEALRPALPEVAATQFCAWVDQEIELLRQVRSLCCINQKSPS